MKRLLLLLFLALTLHSAYAQTVALRTNVLKDALCTPNVALDVAFGRRTSFAVELAGSNRIYGHRFKTIGAAPELRWWFGGRTFDRFFLGVGLKGMHYDFVWNKENRRGESLGGGLTFGYDVYLSRRFSLDFCAGVGALAYWQKHTWDGDTAGLDYRENGVSIVPYQVGVSLVYIIR